MRRWWTVKEARLRRRFREPGAVTPCLPGWRRRVYERVVPALWSRLLDGLSSQAPNGRYWGPSVMERIAAIVDPSSGLVAHITSEDREEFLEAMGAPFREDPTPPDADCRCRYCEWLRLIHPPRDEQLREEFVWFLSEHLELVAVLPNRYDLRQGAPRLAWLAKGKKEAA